LTLRHITAPAAGLDQIARYVFLERAVHEHSNVSHPKDFVLHALLLSKTVGDHPVFRIDNSAMQIIDIL
jgi:hypothetical protein